MIKYFFNWLVYRIKALHHRRFCSLYPPLTWKQYKAYREALAEWNIDKVLLWHNVRKDGDKE